MNALELLVLQTAIADSVATVKRIGGLTVNRRWIGTPYRHPKGTPLSGGFGR